MRQRHLHIIAVFIAILLQPTSVRAALAVGDTFTVGGMTFKVTSISPNEVQVGADTYAIDQNTEGTVNIPSTVIDSDGNSYAVTAICNNAFNHCEKITGVTIPDGIISIGRNAFYRCDNITSVTIPSTVKTWGSGAFSYCKKLSTVIIEEGVTTIGEDAFWGCYDLTNVTIPSTVTSIGKEAFLDCTNLANIDLPEGITTIENGAFGKCTSLTSINIPSSVTSIAGGAFGGCTALAAVHIADMKAWCGIEFGNNTDANPFIVAQHLYLNGKEVKDLVIPEGTTKIGKFVFYACNSLTSVTIPSGITDFDERAFELCEGLTKVTSASSLGKRAFYWCNNITNVTLLEGVTSIGEEAFSGTTYDGRTGSNLQSVTIPSSLRKIGKSAFSLCSSMTAVHIKDVAAWCEIEFNGENSNPLTYAHHLFMDGKEITDLDIPEGVTNIKQYAFSGGEGLTSVTIPSSLASVERDAFKKCSGLTAVHIKDMASWCGIEFDKYNGAQTSNPLQLAHHLFMNGNEVTDLVIPEGVTAIKQYVFRKCENLTSVSIPKSLNSIGNYAFDGCTSLTAVHISDIGAWCAIPFLENGSGDNPLKIAKHLFMNGQEVKDLVIPEGVTSISYGAFNGCKFNSVSIPSTLTKISDFAFNGVEANTVYIKDLAAWCKIKFGDEMSNNSNPLRNVQHLFVDGEEVKDLVIPDGVTSISDYAFMDCNALTSVNTGNSVKKIGVYSFAGCDNIHTVTIGKSVTSIDIAFFCCKELKSVKSMIEDPFEIGNNTFTYRETADDPITGPDAILYVPVGTKALYEATKGWNTFKNIVEMVNIDPIDGETTVNTESLSGQDLSDNVIGDVYYNVGDNGYDPTDGSIVISEATNMGQITNAVPGSADVKENFTGIILRVAAGKGTITVNVKTSGNAQLVVQVGDGIPMIASKTEQGDVGVSYDVEEDTYVYIYAIIGSSASPSMRASSTDEVRIYGFTVSPGASGVKAVWANEDGNAQIFSLDGKPMNEPQKGVNIVRMNNGQVRKMVVK